MPEKKPLTALAVKNAKPREKPYRLAAGKGLYLEVMPTGAKYWRWKYRFGGKEKRLALGVFDDVSLAEAKDRRREARETLRQGIDPAAKRKAERLAAKVAAATSFEAVAREWLEKESTKLAPSTVAAAQRRLESLVFPWIGTRPVSEITPPELLEVLRRVESQGKLETAQRLKQRCGQIFRYAIATGRAERDPSADLRGALATPKVRHRAAVTDPAEVGALLRSIEGFSGQFVTHCALRLLPLLFVRPGELRHAEWSEIDLDAAEWRIPAERTKMRRPHLVPLSTQAVAILRELEPLTGHGRFVFPGIRTIRRPISENTINAALRRLGYSKDEMTGHGFRSLATTLLNEQGWPPDVIERQLAHIERNKVRAAYNRAEHLGERRKMMQAWADYLDALRSGGKVTPIRSRAS